MVKCGWEPWITSPKKLIYDSVNKNHVCGHTPKLKSHSDKLIHLGMLLDSVALK